MMVDKQPDAFEEESSSDRTIGIVMIILGIILLAVGIASWIIWIPIFSWWYFGEIGGIVLLVLGYQRLTR